jgi:hypothetical protein
MPRSAGRALSGRLRSAVKRPIATGNDGPNTKIQSYALFRGPDNYSGNAGRA